MILRTMTVSSQEERASALADADLVLQPPVSRFGAFEFSAIEEMAEVAEAYAAEVLRTCDLAAARAPE